MLLYLGQRIALFVATLVFASLVVFAVMQILPGDAAQTMLGPTATPEAVAALSHKLGLDLPAPIRYARWIGGALHGDLGLSYAYGSPIGPLIASSLAVSAPLALMAMALAAIIGLAAGVYAADRRGRAGDAIVMGFSQIGIAVPNFWLAILLVLVFAVTLTLAARPIGAFMFGRLADHFGRKRFLLNLEEPAEQRVSNLRAREALATGAEVLSVGCPFCMTMLDEAVNSEKNGRDMQVLDIAELVQMASRTPAAPDEINRAKGE